MGDNQSWSGVPVRQRFNWDWGQMKAVWLGSAEDSSWEEVRWMPKEERWYDEKRKEKEKRLVSGFGVNNDNSG